MPDSACIVQKRAHRGQEHPHHVSCAHHAPEVEALVGLVDYAVYKARPRHFAINGAPQFIRSTDMLAIWTGPMVVEDLPKLIAMTLLVHMFSYLVSCSWHSMRLGLGLCRYVLHL